MIYYGKLLSKFFFDPEVIAQDPRQQRETAKQRVPTNFFGLRGKAGTGRE